MKNIIKVIRIIRAIGAALTAMALSYESGKLIYEHVEGSDEYKNVLCALAGLIWGTLARLSIKRLYRKEV